MRHKKLLRAFIILLVSLQTEAAAPPKNISPPSIPQDDMADPFGDAAFNLDEGPPSGDGPPKLPVDDEMEPPSKGQKGPQKVAPSTMPPLEDFSEDMSSLPPDDLPPLPQEKASKEEVPAPVKEEAPISFSWGSIDLHNLAKQAGRKADTYKA